MKRRILLIVILPLLALAVWLLLNNDKSTELKENPLSETVVDTSNHDAPKKPSLATEVVQPKSVQVTSQLPEGNCQLVDDGMPSFDEAFAKSFAQTYAYTGVTFEDMQMIRRLLPGVSRAAELTFTEFKNETVEAEGPYQGWSLQQVLAAAKQGNAQAQFIAGSELMYRSYTQGNSIDIESYRQGKQWLHQAAQAGVEKSLQRLQLLSMFSHRVIWRRSRESDPAFYREIRGDYLAYRQLLEQHESAATYALLLIEELPPQQSALSLTEYPTDHLLLQEAQQKLGEYSRKMALEDEMVDREEKDRLAWLHRNINLYQIAIGIDNECQKLHRLEAKSDTP